MIRQTAPRLFLGLAAIGVGALVLRRGLSPLATTISTPTAAPLVAGIRLRAGKAGSGRGADSMVVEAINTAAWHGGVLFAFDDASAPGIGPLPRLMSLAMAPRTRSTKTSSMFCPPWPRCCPRRSSSTSSKTLALPSQKRTDSA